MTKILALIPESLHKDLFAEVLEAIAQKEKEQQERDKNEVSPWMKTYLENEKKQAAKQAKFLEDQNNKY